MKSCRRHRGSPVGLLALLPITLAVAAASSLAQTGAVIQISDFSKMELKSGGITLPRETELTIHALGGGVRKTSWNEDGMYAYGWIINADTRELVWKMTYENTRSEKGDRAFDGQLRLLAGSYEVYFAAYGYIGGSPFGNFNINIDRRKGPPGDKGRDLGLWQWLADLFGDNNTKSWYPRSKRWGIEVSAGSGASGISTFIPPKDFPGTLYRSIGVGENAYIKQGFSLGKPLAMRIYAIGEEGSDGEMVDHGWIIDAKMHKRIWEMKSSNLIPAGGGRKNVRFDGTVSFPAGDFILYFITDDSHSADDWNVPPPDDPLNYGVSLMAAERAPKDVFRLSTPKEDQNVIVQLVRIGDKQTRSESFTLKEEMPLRIYAVGERSSSSSEMVDYGWIVNAKTREKVWTMDEERTEHAGGSAINRMLDEVVTLPKGTYTVFFTTDDQHAYGSWEEAPPFDPEHWGITVMGEGERFDMSRVEKNVAPKALGIIAQTVRVGDDEDRTENFHLDRPTHVRIYALGEGSNRDMVDYGWIENASTGTTVWEMTYSMTFHAGGGRKNRMVNITMLLDKGDYKLHYVSDGSHSYDDWNTDPPDDPTMWGITLFRED